jgi:glutathione S-transferase
MKLDDCPIAPNPICRYFELEHPDLPLLGVGAREQALVEEWNRRIELGFFGYLGAYFAHTSPSFEDRVRQLPAYDQTAKAAARCPGTSHRRRAKRGGTDGLRREAC